MFQLHAKIIRVLNALALSLFMHTTFYSIILSMGEPKGRMRERKMKRRRERGKEKDKEERGRKR